MSWLHSLAICCCLFPLLIPVRAAAAPSSQTFDCTGFGAIFYDNYVEYREVFLNDAALQIHICAPEAQSLTAKRLADALVKHLPQLDVDAGLPLTGSYERHLLLTNSSPADDDANVIYLGSLSADLDVIREGARFWANERTLAEPWMIEGYAMYLAERAEGHHLLAADACPDIALYAWQPESPEQAICGRIVAVSLFRDLATMVGAAQLHDVLHDLSAQSLPIAHWQLLTALEHITGQDLAPIFLRYHSFPPDEVMLLEQRDALRRRIERATAMAEHNGIKLPASVGEAFSSDAGAGAADLLDQLEPSLELIGAIEGNCGRLTLSCDRYWRPLPETARDLEALLLRLRESHDFLGQYAVLHDNARALSIGIPTKLTQAAAALQPTDAVRQANVSLLYGQVLEERCADTGWSC
ncbi:MAG: hypothetical protein ACJ8CR_28590, partial [Roseiflexaceae bacterium]